MREYIDICKHVLQNGNKKLDRTNTGTISVFGYQARYDLTKGFPLLTTKKVHFSSIVTELLWFIKGDTNIRYLVLNNCHIWDEWPYENYKKSDGYQGESKEEFIKRIADDAAFAEKFGNLGPVYGKQWRDFSGVDQLSDVIKQIKTNPDSRRLIISAWNPKEVQDMMLPPCHAFMQFYVNDNKLSCQLYQRSADLFLGVPFNIASYALLTHMIASVTDTIPFEFIHTLGDIHIYNNHIKQVNEQISREPRRLPRLVLNKDIKDIFEFTAVDIELEDYNPYPRIKGMVAV